MIVPTKDAPQHLGRCLDSIFSRTTYPSFDVAPRRQRDDRPGGAGGSSSGTRSTCSRSTSRSTSRASTTSASRARAASSSSSSTTTPRCRRPSGSRSLVGLAERDGVGAVGPLLLYPNGTVQHAGVVLGLRGTADHIMRGFPSDRRRLRRLALVHEGGLRRDRRLHAVRRERVRRARRVRRALRDPLPGRRPLPAPRARRAGGSSSRRAPSSATTRAPRAATTTTTSTARSSSTPGARRSRRGDPYYNPPLSLAGADYRPRSRRERRLRQLPRLHEQQRRSTSSTSRTSSSPLGDELRRRSSPAIRPRSRCSASRASRRSTSGDARKGALGFPDGGPPTLVHAWTPREAVRELTEELALALRLPVRRPPRGQRGRAHRRPPRPDARASSAPRRRARRRRSVDARPSAADAALPRGRRRDDGDRRPAARVPARRRPGRGRLARVRAGALHRRPARPASSAARLGIARRRGGARLRRERAQLERAPSCGASTSRSRRVNRARPAGQARPARPRLRPTSSSRELDVDRAARRPRPARSPRSEVPALPAPRRRARPAGPRRRVQRLPASRRSCRSSSRPDGRSCCRRRTSAASSRTARSACCSAAATRSRSPRCVERLLDDDELRVAARRGGARVRRAHLQLAGERREAARPLRAARSATTAARRPHGSRDVPASIERYGRPRAAAARATRPCATTATRPTGCRCSRPRAGDLKDVQRPWALKAIVGAVRPGARLLEIGAGEPLVAELLARLGYDVTVVDPYDGRDRGPADVEALRAAYPRVRFVAGPLPATTSRRRAVRLHLLDLGARAPPARGDRRASAPGSARLTRAGGYTIHAIDHVAPRRRRRRPPRAPRPRRGALGIAGGRARRAARRGSTATRRPTSSPPRATTAGAARAPYDEFPMRRCVSIQLCVPVERRWRASTTASTSGSSPTAAAAAPGLPRVAAGASAVAADAGDRRRQRLARRHASSWCAAFPASS